MNINNKVLTRSGPYIIVFLVSLAFYWLTVYPSIEWWEPAEYILAAHCLGIAHPPGSLILTILGWIVTRVFFFVPAALVLNLFCGCIGALTSTAVFFLVYKLLKGQVGYNSAADDPFIIPVLVLACLAVSFSHTQWEYAVKLNPYLLSVVNTLAIVWAMLQWWEKAGEPENRKWIFLVLLLVGLDLSVHRANIIILPGLLVWVLIRHPKALLNYKFWAFASVGLGAGAAFHLVLIPVAGLDPAYNFGDPSTLSRWWDYISLKQYGGNLGQQVFPRRAPFGSYQFMDFIKVFKACFFSWHRVLGFLGFVPGMLGLWGIGALCKRNRMLGAGLIIVFLCLLFGTILYFNIPPNYFRPLDRHYLPALIVFGLFMVYGGGAAGLLLLEKTGRYKITVCAGAAVIVLLTVNSQVLENYKKCDGTGRYFAADYGKNILCNLPDKAVLFTTYERSTWTAVYWQQVQKQRQDVAVCNLNLMNLHWYIWQLKRRYPDIVPPLNYKQRQMVRLQRWQEITINIPVKQEGHRFNLPDTAAVPDTLAFKVPPTIQGGIIRASDVILFMMIQYNGWKRPVYFSEPVDPLIKKWLGPMLRREGLVWQLIPYRGVSPNIDMVRDNVFNKYTYTAFNDPLVSLKPDDRAAAIDFYTSFIFLAGLESQRGNVRACRETIEKMKQALPFEQVMPPDHIREMAEGLCKGE